MSESVHSCAHVQQISILKLVLSTACSVGYHVLLTIAKRVPYIARCTAFYTVIPCGTSSVEASTDQHDVWLEPFGNRNDDLPRGLVISLNFCPYLPQLPCPPLYPLAKRKIGQEHVSIRRASA